MGQIPKEIAKLGIAVESQRIFSLGAVERDDRDPPVLARGEAEVPRGVIAQRMAQSLYRIRRVHPTMTSPPATTIAWPFIDAAPGDASHSTASATSSGRTRRPCGLDLVSSALASSSDRPVFATMVSTARAMRGVSVKPGQTALTVIPVLANSSASARVRPMRPCLAAQ